MNRQILVSAVAGFVIGMSVTDLLKNSEVTKCYKLASETVKVTGKVATEYMDGYYKLIDQNNEIFKLAKSYEDAKNSIEKEHAAKMLVYKVNEFNLPIAK